MCYEFITYFVLALQRTVRKLRHASVFSSILSSRVHEASYYAYKLMIVGRVPNINQKVLS